MQAENSWNIATRAEAARRTFWKSTPTDMAADARAFWWMLLALGLISAAAAAAPPPVVVAGATGQTGRRCLERLAKMGGVSAIGGVRNPEKVHGGRPPD